MRLVITECGGFASGPDPRAKHSDIIEKKETFEDNRRKRIYAR